VTHRHGNHFDWCSCDQTEIGVRVPELVERPVVEPSGFDYGSCSQSCGRNACVTIVPVRMQSWMLKSRTSLLGDARHPIRTNDGSYSGPVRSSPFPPTRRIVPFHSIVRTPGGTDALRLAALLWSARSPPRVLTCQDAALAAAWSIASGTLERSEQLWGHARGISRWGCTRHSHVGKHLCRRSAG
jgi:hypothetical protein